MPIRFPRQRSRSIAVGRALAALGSLCLLTLSGDAVALAQQPSSSGPAVAAKPARLDYKETKLPNGLKVITLEDHRAPIVCLQVWYRVGSKEEPQGKHGFAHLFEHMMFKGSANVPINQFTRYIEQIGGTYNADTFFDRTRYYEVVPINALDRVLFLEADRMRSLLVDAANLKSETDVVKEEYRVGKNQPYGELLENVLSLAYPAGHPYYHSTIGDIPQLEAAKLEDVKAFHDQYYRPDNATLVLVGDFKTSEAQEKIRQYFGDVPKSPTGKFTRLPIPADTKDMAMAIRKTFPDKLAPLSMVGAAFRLPKPTDKDAPVFDVITQILSAGQSSRLYRALVRDKQLAVQAAGLNLDLQQGGLYFVFGVANIGKNPAELETALNAEVERLRMTDVTADELTKAKNQVLTALVFGRVSVEAKANALGQADLDTGSPEPANREFEDVSRVTVADVRRVAAQYFADNRRRTFIIQPDRAKPAVPPTAAPKTTANATKPGGTTAKEAVK